MTEIITTDRRAEWRRKYEMKKLDKLIETIRQAAKETWPGQEGEYRANKVEKCIRRFLPQYAAMLDLSELKVLQAIEDRRNYSVVNFYQDSKFPDVSDIAVYETKDEGLEAVGKEFRCPSCKGVSTDPYECNAGTVVDDKSRECDWKSYGLFGCLGKGFKFTIKEKFLEHPMVDEIFMPLTMEESDEET